MLTQYLRTQRKLNSKIKELKKTAYFICMAGVSVDPYITVRKKEYHKEK